MELPAAGPGEAILRARRADAALGRTPVLMLSADATESSRQRLLAAGANDYPTKPLDVRKFLDAITAALASTLPVRAINTR